MQGEELSVEVATQMILNAFQDEIVDSSDPSVPWYSDIIYYYIQLIYHQIVLTLVLVSRPLQHLIHWVIRLGNQYC